MSTFADDSFYARLVACFADKDTEESAHRRAAALCEDEYEHHVRMVQRDEQFDRDMVLIGDADQALEDDDRGQRASVSYPDALDVAVSLCEGCNRAEACCGCDACGSALCHRCAHAHTEEACCDEPCTDHAE